MQKGDSISVRMRDGSYIAATVKTISKATAGITVTLDQYWGAYRKGDVLRVARYECKKPNA